MATIAPVALECARGEAKTYTATHQTSGTDTTPINISGWAIKVTAKDARGTVVLNKNASVTNGPSGLYTWSVSHADTLLRPLAYAMDIQRADSGSETAMAVGTWTITPEVLY